MWWTIIGIALLPGFLMSAMHFSNLMHWKLKRFPDVTENTTIIMCVHNEGECHLIITNLSVPFLLNDTPHDYA